MSQQQIESYYPLSPLQQGLLFRSLFAPHSSAYFQQFTCTLAGPLDEAAFERSWQRLVERHAVLRTAFAWEGLDEPLQVVGRKVRLPFRREDWRALPPHEWEQRWRELCEADREQGFKPSRAPLMRIALLRMADEEWRLIWSFHHLLVDGWSNSILLREVFALYDAFTRGEEPALPVPRPYREYVAWLQRQSLATAEAYWRRRLEGVGTPSPLPVEAGPRSEEPDDKDFAERHGRLSLEQSEKLRGFARRHRLTMNTLVQGAWALLLARYAGRSEAVFGVTLAGRPDALPGADSMVGVFVNTLPARVPVPEDLPVAHWLAGVQMDQAELNQFEHTPLARVQAWCSLPVIFDKLLVFENYPLEVNTRAMRSVAVREVNHREYTQYPLALVAVPAAELWLQIKYDGARFDQPAVLRMLEHLRAVLAGMAAADSGQPVGHLSLLTPGEHQQVLAEWNDVPAGLFPDRCLHQLFEEQAALGPDRPAVTYEGRSLTYGELDRLAGRLARRLRDAGVGPEVRVGLCMERSLELVVALLGTLKAGGAYVPLDPVHPRERLEAMLEDAAPAVLLVQPHLRRLLPKQGYTILELQTDPADPAAGPSSPVVSGVQPDNLAYVLFTSGSTGRPKGVMVPHRAIVNRVLWMHEVMTLRPDDVVVQKTPFSFDASIWEFFLPWSAGLRLVIAAPEGHRDTAYLADLMARERVTILQLVPSVLQVLLEEPRLREVRSLRRVFCGGEALTPYLQERFFARVEGSDLHNLYGPTEAAIDATHWPCRRDAVRPVVLIGRPIVNDQVYLAGAGFQPAPLGVPGELLIGGVGLARGYKGRPDLTADKFVPDPFSEQPGQRLYRTGDLARHLPDGAIEFLGRVDHQVKIRGVRIELSEIESVLLRHPSVREAVAVVRESDGGDKRLVAYAVPAVNEELDEAEIRSYLGRKLPEAMVPSRVVQLSRMPLLPNGKIDRKALPASEGPAAPERGGALLSPVQEIVAVVWSEILGCPVTAAQDDFFELGGHSLLATRVVSRLRQAFQIDFPVRALFDHPTVEELAGEIERLLSSAAQAPPPLRPAGRSSDLPLSYAQQRLWLLEQVQPGAGAYHLPLAVRFSGPLDPQALERSLAEVMRRHEVLRTCFPAEGGTPRQVILPPSPPALLRIDLLAVPAGVRETLLPALLRDLARCPFDLARGPLLRATLIAMGTGDHVLSVTLHHIVSDGWSMSLLLEELAALYRAFSLGERSPLPELAVQYSDFAQWEQSWLRGPALDARIEHWMRTLAGAPPRVELPTDLPQPERTALRGAARSRWIGEDLSAKLRKLSRRAGATLFMVLLEAFEAVLSRWTHQDDLVVGTVIANRTRAETETLIGCFMNFLPLRLRSQPGESGLELLARVRSSVLEAYSYQDCPFEKLVQALNPDRRSGSNPLFNVGFLLQTQPRTAAGGALTASFVPVDLRASLLDLRLVAWESAGGLQVSLEYRTDLFTGETAELLLEAYEQALEWIAEGPERAVSGIPLPERLERQAEAARSRERRPEIAVAATFTAEPLEKPLRFWMEELGFDTGIAFAPYGQVFQELLGSETLLARNADGLNVVLVRFEDWCRGRSLAAEDLRRNVLDLAGALRSAASRSRVPLLVFVCPGSPGSLAEPGFAGFIRESEDLLAAELATAGGIHLVTPAELAALYPVPAYYDPHGDELGHIPYTPAFFNALATMVARRLFVLRTPPYKVIAVDCDRTLWKGVCAEDGPQGVELDAPRQALQELLVQQHEAGMLICVCSKNNEQDVLDVFDSRSDMPLRRRHVVGWRANWRPKSENLAALAAELQLGLDAFIFIDDNPVECAEVQAACPEVLVIELPANPAEIPALLRNIWAFDRLHVTDEDRSRTEMYRQNEERENFRTSSHSFREFLKNLMIDVDVSPLQPRHVQRVAQLSQRTNQFNLTTIRRSESEIEEILHSPERQCLVVDVRDRFGEYGLAGAVIYGFSPEALEVETLLLSCRVLGRGVEHRVLEELGRIAAARGLSRVDLAFAPTARNQPARDFLASFGEEPDEPVHGGFVYRLPVQLLEGLTRRFLEDEPPAEGQSTPGLLASPRMGRPGVSGETP